MRKKYTTILILLLFFIMFLASNNNVYANTAMLQIYDCNASYNVNGDDVLILYDNKCIDISDYHLYYFERDSVETSFYAYDSITQNDNDYVYLVMGVYIYENGTFSKLNLQLFDKQNSIYYNLLVEVDEEDFSFVLSNALLISENIDNSVIERIYSSFSVYEQIQNQINANINILNNSKKLPDIVQKPFPDEGGSTTNTITGYKYNSYGVDYDSYTNDDYYNSNDSIYNYSSDNFNDCYLANGNITDDPIVNIIPKELCYSTGHHLYIGREYGFFINTTVDSYTSTDYQVDIMVFVIEFEKPDFSNFIYKGSLEIKVLFQYRYRAIDKTRRNNMWDGYDSSLSQIVYPHLLYDASDYYLSDISMKHSLENEIHANPYEQGYSANSDEGLFFTEAFYDTKGRGLKKFNNEFEKDLFGYAIGAFDLTEGKGGFLVDLIVDLSDYGYYYDEIQSGGQPDETIIEFQPNRTNQIKKYEKLIKNLNITIKQPKEEKQIFGTGDSVKSTFEINCFDEGTLTRFINSIHLSVGVDNTVRYLGQMYGTYDILCTEESFYSTSKDKEASFNNVYSDTLEYKGDAVFYKYVANYTGKHIFETTGNTDTYIELYKFNNGYLDKNDDGGNERNARLQFHLIKGEIYYIKVMGYNDSKVGDFNFIIMYDKYSAINATVNSNYYFTIDEVDECIIIAFTPPYSDSYIFETTGSTDTYMCLLDPNFNQYTFDDNSGSLNNAKIQYSLISGRTFYILIKCSSNSTGSFTFKITES